MKRFIARKILRQMKNLEKLKAGWNQLTAQTHAQETVERGELYMNLSPCLSTGPPQALPKISKLIKYGELA